MIELLSSIEQSDVSSIKHLKFKLFELEQIDNIAIATVQAKARTSLNPGFVL